MKITRIKLSFSNAYLVQGTQTILVDTGMPGEERKILHAAEQAGVKAGDIRMMGGFMGGNLFGSRPNYHHFADDLAAVRQSIHALLAAGVQTFYVGYGGPLARDAVARAFATQA
jgi:glyoxylase-like metal-dependent hydrolase (beta-lactamase superfamily II)